MKYIVSVAGRDIEVEVDGDRVLVSGKARAATLRPIPGTPMRQLVIDERPTILAMRSTGRGQWSLAVRGERWDVEVVDERTRHIRSLTGGSDRPQGPVVLRAPMPGLVVRVVAKAGEQVTAGAGLVVLEAMKMENELKAPAAGVVEAVRVEPGQAVEKGQVLVEFRPPRR